VPFEVQLRNIHLILVWKEVLVHLYFFKKFCLFGFKCLNRSAFNDVTLSVWHILIRWIITPFSPSSEEWFSSKNTWEQTYGYRCFCTSNFSPLTFNKKNFLVSPFLMGLMTLRRIKPIFYIYQLQSGRETWLEWRKSGCCTMRNHSIYMFILPFCSLIF